jgi:inner membrane protein
MDLITQGLLGSTVAQAGFSEKLGKKAAYYGFLIGLLPDFDIVSSFWGPWTSLKYHRGPTHALPVLLFLALPVGFLAKKISGSDKELKPWVFMAFWALVTHPLIDWCTTYGTPLLWPFTSQRFANDSLPIIDPLYSLPLFVVTAIGIFNLLTPRQRKALALTALAISTIYAYSGYRTSIHLADRGRGLFIEQGFEPTKVRATPTLLNTRLFRIIAKDKNNDFMVTYLKKGNGSTLNPILKIVSDKGPLVDKAMQHEIGKLFTWFSMDMISPKLIKNADGTTTVSLRDMRYGFMIDQDKSLFEAAANFDAQGHLINFTRKRGRNDLSFKQELRRMAREYFD